VKRATSVWSDAAVDGADGEGVLLRTEAEDDELLGSDVGRVFATGGSAISEDRHGPPALEAPGG
jgi:hypothetical protein